MDESEISFMLPMEAYEHTPKQGARTAFRPALDAGHMAVAFWVFPQRRDMLRELARQVFDPKNELPEDTPVIAITDGCPWMPWSEDNLALLLRAIATWPGVPDDVRREMRRAAFGASSTYRGQPKPRKKGQIGRTLSEKMGVKRTIPQRFITPAMAAERRKALMQSMAKEGVPLEEQQALLKDPRALSFLGDLSPKERAELHPVLDEPIGGYRVGDDS